MYFDEPVVRDQLQRLAATSAPGSRLVVDFTPPPGTGTARNKRQLWLQRLGRGGSGERFRLTVAPSDAASLVATTGRTVTEVTSLRDAARALVPAASHLPVDAVNPAKTLIAASVA